MLELLGERKVGQCQHSTACWQGNEPLQRGCCSSAVAAEPSLSHTCKHQKCFWFSGKFNQKQKYHCDLVLSERKSSTTLSMHCYAPHLKRTHRDLMYANHSTVHSSVQTTISKMLTSFEIMQITLRRK